MCKTSCLRQSCAFLSTVPRVRAAGSLVLAAIPSRPCVVCADNVRDELIRTLYRDEARYDTLLQENDDAAARRATCSEMYALLCRALDIVDEVHHFDVK